MDLHHCHKLVLFGGSFDPPHLAHAALPALAREAVDAEAVLYIPVGQAPHKQDRRQSPAHHRLAMLRLMLASMSRAHIITDEIDRGCETPSYTVDTLQRLRNQLDPDVEFRLLIGGDMLHIFHQWRSYERIIEMAEPLVMVRPPDTVESLLAAVEKQERTAWRQRLLDLPRIDVNSTTIRQRVSEGMSIVGMVHPEVEDYIRRQGLYRG